MSTSALLVHELRTMLRRDLHALDRQLAAYAADATLRQPLPGLTNCGGTLVRHLAAHLPYHAGQIDAHRRIASGDATTIGMLSLTALA